MAKSIHFCFVFAVVLLRAVTRAQPNYTDALSKCLLFFEAQRSGKIPMNQRITWRGDSALHDGSIAQVDLVGGYYDAGDNIKYTFPMAFTITMLSWGVIEYGSKYSAASELQHAQESIRWGTDYLLKAFANPTQLWVQVGDGSADHNCWERPEDMDTPRTLTQVNTTFPGTEVTAETAAALAAASIVFKGSDGAYSNTLLQASLKLFQFSNNYQASYTGECPFYCSFSGYNDELLWAASWLYKATGSSTYQQYLIENKSFSTPNNVFSWDMKLPGVQVLLSKEYFDGESSLLQYKLQADTFFCSLLPNNPQTSFDYTPGLIFSQDDIWDATGGLLYVKSGGNTQYSTAASFLAAVYADYIQSANVQFNCGNISFSNNDLLAFLSSQVNYILGMNPNNMSYMVGAGGTYPLQAHHRGASIVSIHLDSATCSCGEGFEWFHKDAPNPNMLMGAIVGGPGPNDEFLDARSNSPQLEPTTYINAPFCGVLARLVS